MQRKAAEDAARSAVRESSDTVRSRRAQCQAVPDNPETGGTVTRRGRGCTGEKTGNRAPKRIQPQLLQPPPPATTTTTTTHATARNIIIGWNMYEWLAVVASAAACCSCRDENPPPPNEARAIRKEGRRAVSAQLAGRGWYVHDMHLLAGWVGPCCE